MGMQLLDMDQEVLELIVTMEVERRQEEQELKVS
jgi:hypothetical protein